VSSDPGEGLSLADRAFLSGVLAPLAVVAGLVIGDKHGVPVGWYLSGFLVGLAVAWDTLRRKPPATAAQAYTGRRLIGVATAFALTLEALTSDQQMQDVLVAAMMCGGPLFAGVALRCVRLIRANRTS
jgi:hypothetical protein